VAVALTAMFVAIYVPVIASEERFLRATFPEFDEYCRRVPRLIPRITPASGAGISPQAPGQRGRFFMPLYLKHREYNALLGVALLYFCLVFLRAALNAIFHGQV
jgi:hypothetical protein